MGSTGSSEDGGASRQAGSTPALGTFHRILPGLTHYNIFSSPLFAAVALAFLDQEPS
jgi:hypothetical protein